MGTGQKGITARLIDDIMNTCDLHVELPETMTADEAEVLLAIKLLYPMSTNEM